MNKPIDLKLDTVPAWIAGKKVSSASDYGDVYNPATGQVRERVAAFREQLRQLGWPDEDLHIEERWATDNLGLIRANAAELVKIRPDVIFFTGGRVVPIIQG